MKKIILTVFLVISLVKVDAQCNQEYRSLPTFGTDTTAFLLYNFIDRVDCYKGKTFQVVIQDLQIPVHRVFPIPIMTNVRKTNTFYMSIMLDSHYTMNVKFEEILDQNEIKEKIGLIGTWYKHLDYFKNLKITNIEVSIPEYSPHYPKYKDKLK